MNAFEIHPSPLAKYYFLGLILLFCIGHTNGQTLNDNQRIHTINVTGSLETFTIPNNPDSDYITFFLRGGRGGHADLNGCISRGGEGATVKATVRIGYRPGQVPPGANVRIMVGEDGEDDDTDCDFFSCYDAGAGGGGTAVLIRDNGSYEIIAAAGGGGGAYQGKLFDDCIDSQKGQGGRATENGGNGQGNAGGSGGGDGDGGTGGGIFDGGELSGGGGGAYGDGEPLGVVNAGGQGYDTGGEGGDGNVSAAGGWGFGGGGSAYGAGGGGGGYSGGGGGGQLNNGGGGGSYVHPDYAINTEIIAGRDGSPGDLSGKFTYQFICIPRITGFEYVQQLCSEDALGRIQLTHDIRTSDRCANFLEWNLEPINGWNHLGNGVFSFVRTGDYTATVKNTLSEEILATYSFTVGVNPVAPVPRCKDITVTLANGQYQNNNLANLLNDGSTSDCDDPLILEASTLSFDCDDVGDNAVILTATGNNGISATCTSTVTVVPQADALPVANCVPDFSVDLANGTDGQLPLVVADINNNSFTPPCLMGLSIDITEIDCADVGNDVTVTLTVEDLAGRSDQCITTIEVLDSNQPTANCQTNYELLLQGDGTAALNPADLNNGSLSNNCTDLSFTADIINFDCNDIGPNTVTITATDGYNRTSTCQSTVNIVEIASPVALCRNITVGLDENGDYDLTAAEIDNGSNAGCSTALSSSVVSFNCDDLGEQVVTLTATSVFNQQATCQATVTVIDTIPPTAVCDPFTLNNFPVSINPFRTAIFQDQEDNCGVASTVFLDDTYFDCDEVGLQLVRIEVVDDSGNRDTCAINITINAEAETVVASCNDNNNVVELDDDGTYFLDEAALYNLMRFSPGVDCYDFSTLNPTTSQPVFTCGNLGAPIPVTVSLTEPGGETTSCVLSIEAVDQIDPVCASAPQVDIKVFLAGAYDNSTGLMRDDLRALGLIPTTSPYGGGIKKTTSAILAEAGQNAIVDWVELEIRSSGTPTLVLYTQSALLQRDGDIVDVDGVSPVYLTEVPTGAYYVAVRHRNHLAIMTGSSVLLD